MSEMIPKIIHYCWFGENKKNKLILNCIKSWKKYCPDYEIKEWNESNFDVNCCQYVKEAYEAKKWAFVSDYARLWIVYNYGGIYLDTDVELKSSLDFLLGSELFVSFENESNINTGVGFGAIEKNEVINAILNSYKDIFFRKTDGSLDLTPCTTRNTETLLELFGDDIYDAKKMQTKNITVLSPDYLCPLDPITGAMNITNNTIGIHWYDASWRNKAVNIREKILRPIKRTIGVDSFKYYFKKDYDRIDSGELCLIITGCIYPNKNQKYLVVSNVEDRLNQYIESIIYYINDSVISNIVFCENSNFNYKDVKVLYDIANKRGKHFEWLSFSGNSENVVKYGKGYGEGEIIEYALENSGLLNKCKVFAKITGRLKISNINCIVNGIRVKQGSVNADIYRKKGIDTRFYIIDKSLYCKYFLKAYTHTNDTQKKAVALEDVFYNTIKKNRLFFDNTIQYYLYILGFQLLII